MRNKENVLEAVRKSAKLLREAQTGIAPTRSDLIDLDERFVWEMINIACGNLGKIETAFKKD